MNKEARYDKWERQQWFWKERQDKRGRFRNSWVDKPLEDKYKEFSKAFPSDVNPFVLDNPSLSKDDYKFDDKTQTFDFRPVFYIHGPKHGWEQPLSKISINEEHKELSKYIPALTPRLPKENYKRIKSCAILMKEKFKFCKSKPTDSCEKSDTSENLKKKHNDIMKCRNIRALENHANCDSYGKGWLEPNDYGHGYYIGKYEEEASNCYEIDNKRREAKALIEQNAIKAQQKTSNMHLQKILRAKEKSKSKSRSKSRSKNKHGVRISMRRKSLKSMRRKKSSK